MHGAVGGGQQAVWEAESRPVHPHAWQRRTGGTPTRTRDTVVGDRLPTQAPYSLLPRGKGMVDDGSGQEHADAHVARQGDAHPAAPLGNTVLEPRTTGRERNLRAGRRGTCVAGSCQGPAQGAHTGVAGGDSECMSHSARAKAHFNHFLEQALCPCMHTVSVWQAMYVRLPLAQSACWTHPAKAARCPSLTSPNRGRGLIA